MARPKGKSLDEQVAEIAVTLRLLKAAPGPADRTAAVAGQCAARLDAIAGCLQRNTHPRPKTGVRRSQPTGPSTSD